MRLFLAGGLSMILAGATEAPAGEAKATGCDAMVGVWEYVPPSAPGHAIIARQGRKYLGIFVNTLPEPYGGQTRTREPRAGRQAKWWFIGPDGKRGTMGAGRLLR